MRVGSSPTGDTKNKRRYVVERKKLFELAEQLYHSAIAANDFNSALQALHLMHEMRKFS